MEVVDDLVYITDRIGGLVIRRCLRPSTFLASIQKSVDLARQLDAGRRRKVVALKAV